jgi:hypothetical protein
MPVHYPGIVLSAGAMLQTAPPGYLLCCVDQSKQERRMAENDQGTRHG